MAAHTVSSIKLSNEFLQLKRNTSKSEVHRALVNIAIKAGLDPIEPDRTEMISLSVNMHMDMLAKLKVLEKAHNIPFSTLFAGLANAGLQYLEKAEEGEAKVKETKRGYIESQLLLNENEEDRPEQKAYWMGLANGLHLNKIVMAEGSTGVGKGKAIISAAIMSAKEGKKPVLVCAPTIKILSQLYDREYLGNPRAVEAAEGLKIAFLPGKQEFVDEAKLRDHLAEFPHADVQAWIDVGAPNNEGSALSRMSEALGFKLSWMMADLRVAAGDSLRAEDFALEADSSKEGTGFLYLSKVKEAAKGADIVFLTQAMLARQVLSVWPDLPMIKDKEEFGCNPVILIDEAHVFEEAVSSASSKDLSLFRLRVLLARQQKELKGGPTSSFAKAIKGVNRLMKLCQNEYDGDKTIVLCGYAGRNVETNDRFNSELLYELEGVFALLSKRGKMQKSTELSNHRLMIRDMIRTLKDDVNNRLLLCFSPQKKFPSLSCGEASVSKYLGLIWAKASGGVGLISATFLLPWDNEMQSKYIRQILNLPLSKRLETPSAVEWSEIYKSPVRYMPSKEAALSLLPPDSKNQEDLDSWCAAQARMFVPFNKDTKGGTLMLCTSYVQVKALKAALVAEGIDEQRIIENSGRLVTDQEQYIKLYHEGLKPIWLALGPAWTGVDLTLDVPAGEDYLLADLVITRIPLGLNKSVTMDARTTSNFYANAFEAMLRFKQGLGRLIRRHGLNDRRLLLLDGRLACSSEKNSNFINKLVDNAYLMLSKYKKREVLGK